MANVNQVVLQSMAIKKHGHTFVLTIPPSFIRHGVLKIDALYNLSLEEVRV